MPAAVSDTLPSPNLSRTLIGSNEASGATPATLKQAFGELGTQPPETPCGLFVRWAIVPAMWVPWPFSSSAVSSSFTKSRIAIGQHVDRGVVPAEAEAGVDDGHDDTGALGGRVDGLPVQRALVARPERPQVPLEVVGVVERRRQRVDRSVDLGRDDVAPAAVLGERPVHVGDLDHVGVDRPEASLEVAGGGAVGRGPHG